MQTVICKLDTDLNVIWKRWYGGETELHYVTDFALTSDGGCIGVFFIGWFPIIPLAPVGLFIY